uniref:Uncharacterized protein n=1 Tax=Arundo donax TaxID=35708 RepID=A0A0A8ZJW5_ARUDO
MERKGKIPSSVYNMKMVQLKVMRLFYNTQQTTTNNCLVLLTNQGLNLILVVGKKAKK